MTTFGAETQEDGIAIFSFTTFKLCPVCGGRMRDETRYCHEYCTPVFGGGGVYFTAAEIAPVRDYIHERLQEMYRSQTWRERLADRLERWAYSLRQDKVPADGKRD